MRSNSYDRLRGTAVIQPGQTTGAIVVRTTDWEASDMAGLRGGQGGAVRLHSVRQPGHAVTGRQVTA